MTKKIHQYICLACMVTLLGLWYSASHASAKPIAQHFPGDVVDRAGTTRIYLDHGLELVWPNDSGPSLQQGNGTLIAKINPAQKAHQASGAEALDLEVEETDLGSRTTSSKNYLQSKKKPKGVKLEDHLLSNRQVVKDTAETKSTNIQGIKISRITFPNASYILQISWPNYTEEAYFDRRNSLVHNEQTYQIGSVKASLKQWIDGSFERRFKKASGELGYIFDANDKSYHISFFNAGGDLVQEILCAKSQCSVDE